jgi:hypothetical protein
MYVFVDLLIGFSLTNWYGNMTLTAGATLYPTQLSMLTEALGVTDYLNNASSRCDRSSATYKPETAGLTGWKIGQWVVSFILNTNCNSADFIQCLPFEFRV